MEGEEIEEGEEEGGNRERKEVGIAGRIGIMNRAASLSV
jgi:hypothetical protein